MRLFVGVRPAPEAIAHLAEALQALTRTGPEASSAIRWVPAQRWHLTLAFLGEVDEDRVARLVARLERAARRCGPAELQLHGGGHFGRTVLWVAVVGDVQPIARLAAASRAAARRAGISIEDERTFRLHLTVARGRPGADLRPWARELAAYAGPSWTASRVALVRSRLGPSTTHDDLQVWDLGGPG